MKERGIAGTGESQGDREVSLLFWCQKRREKDKRRKSSTRGKMTESEKNGRKMDPRVTGRNRVINGK